MSVTVFHGRQHFDFELDHVDCGQGVQRAGQLAGA